MLAGLDDVDWASMEHGYGPATDVPDMLRGMLSADAEVWYRSLNDFWDKVHNEGHMSDCTVACVPFLVEIALRPGTDSRWAVLDLIASIGGVADEGFMFWDRGEENTVDIFSLHAAARAAINTELPPSR